MYNNSNYWDSYGLLYTFSGTAQSPIGPVFGDVAAPAINLFYSGGFQEEGWTGGFTGSYDVGTSAGGNGVFQVAADGGSSYNSGSLLRGACGWNGTIPAGFGPNAQQSNSGGGSSGLSGGAIAGIVIGSVVGAALLLVCLLCVAGLVGRGGKKGGTDDSVSKPTGAYSQQEESRNATDHSQVELADANGETNSHA